MNFEVPHAPGPEEQTTEEQGEEILINESANPEHHDPVANEIAEQPKEQTPQSPENTSDSIMASVMQFSKAHVIQEHDVSEETLAWIVQHPMVRLQSDGSTAVRRHREEEGYLGHEISVHQKRLDGTIRGLNDPTDPRNHTDYKYADQATARDFKERLIAFKALRGDFRQ